MLLEPGSMAMTWNGYFVQTLRLSLFLLPGCHGMSCSPVLYHPCHDVVVRPGCLDFHDHEHLKP